MKRMYQHIIIPGKGLKYEGRGRSRSKFWDKGKWDNFINPLIPEEAVGLPFFEIGSNSGLMLKLAEDKGFKKVIGIEAHPDRVTTAKWYRESIGGKYETIHKFMDASFDWNRLPRLGLTLIANAHYYFPVVDFGEMVTSLRDRTLYCIVVSANVGKRSGMASPYLEDIRGFFNDWTEVGIVEGISTENDPSPREGMYGVIFKSNLETIDLDQWWKQALEHYSKLKHRRSHLHTTTEDFYKKVLSGEPFDIKDTDLFRYYTKDNRLSPNGTHRKLLKKKELAEDIKENGIKKLVYISKFKLEDGFSRCVIARLLGYKKIIVKMIRQKNSIIIPSCEQATI